MLTRDDFFKIKTDKDWNEMAPKFEAAGFEMDREMFEHLRAVFAQYEFSMEELNPNKPVEDD